MNISLTQLRIANTLGSPLFSPPSYVSGSRLRIYSSKFKNIENHFYFTSIPNKFLTLQRTEVTKTLKSVVKINSNEFLSEIYIQNQPIINNSYTILFDSCVFISCFSEDDGGVLNAIAPNVSDYSLNIFRSFFSDCKSIHAGGAIHALNYQANISKLCFLDCQSNLAASFFVASHIDSNSSVELVTVTTCNTVRACNKSSWGVSSTLNLRNFNVSRMYAKDSTSCGFVETKKTSDIKYCTFSNCKGGSGYRIKSAKNITINKFFNFDNITKTVCWQGVIHSPMTCVFDEMIILNSDYPAIYGNVNYDSIIVNSYVEYNPTNTRFLAGRWKTNNLDCTKYDKTKYDIKISVNCTAFIYEPTIPQDNIVYVLNCEKFMRKAASALGIIVIILLVSQKLNNHDKIEQQVPIVLSSKQNSVVPVQKNIV